MAKAKKGAAHEDQLHRLSRVEGQIRGISKMIEERRYCVDILTQIKAVKSAVSSIEQKILEQHFHHCVHQAMTSKNKSEVSEMLDEIMTLLKKVSR